MAAGGVVVIKRGIIGDVKDERTQRGGTVTKSVTSTSPPQTTLIYLPPAGVRELEDIVQYNVGDAQQAPIQINVRPLAPTLDSSKLYDASFKALFVLLILAVLVESGLALLFRWRPFLDYFASRSMNVLVAFLFSLLLVRLFDLDIASQLIGIYTESRIDIADWKGWPGVASHSHDYCRRQLCCEPHLPELWLSSDQRAGGTEEAGAGQDSGLGVGHAGAQQGGWLG
ncbi:hypothetical protein [Bradyrhizobium sp. LA2.1]|uniref:hypothetical protein n=1 Tax=Bradyrhizobium sp. LA2.1 TaxID=3156376 RepID=UPI00339538BE